MKEKIIIAIAVFRLEAFPGRMNQNTLLIPKEIMSMTRL